MLTAEASALAGLAVSTRHVCVVDARLALSKLGMVALARLCTACAVWLPSELRQVLVQARRHLESPGELVPRVFCGALRNLDLEAEATAVGWELSQWEHLPGNDELASLPFYYLGDRADECAVPPSTDRRLRTRYEQFHQGLYQLMMQSSYDRPRGRTVAACTLDAVALCAALQPYGAFVLTRLESDGEGAPAMCDYLDAWGVATTEVPNAGGPPAVPLAEMLARAGLGVMAWAQIQLAAVHVLVPGLPVLGDEDKGLDVDMVASRWSQASVFWHRVWG